MPDEPRSRRAFLSETAALGALGFAAGCVKGAAANTQPEPAPVPERRTIAPGESVRCAFAGAGRRGATLLRETLELDGVDVLAVCDTYTVWRNRALNWCREQQPDAAAFSDYAEMLDAQPLDAVVIATPDHLHVPMALAALDRGVDVYCETPVATTAQSARTLRNRARETGAVFQTGTQLRSAALYRKARDIVRNGDLGDMLLVQVHRHFQTARLGPASVPNEANRDNIAWEAFLGDAPARPFDPLRYFNWGHFRDYANGYFGSLMVHHLDLCRYITGSGMPARILAAGGRYHEDDGRTTPDTISALADFSPDGFHFNYATTDANAEFGLVERYLGTAGTIEVRDMSHMTIARGDAREDVHDDSLHTAEHLRGFFDAVRARGETVAPVDDGFMSAACAHMAIVSMEQHRAVAWDPEVEAPVA